MGGGWDMVLDWILGAELLAMPGLPMLVLQHIGYVIVPLAIAMAIALPLGIWVGHVGRFGTLAINASNVGRAVPSLGVVVIAFIGFGLGIIPVYVALVAMAIPPMVTNAFVGVREVDAEVRDAAVGMGLTDWQIIRDVEIPMALPVIMAGIRTSAVQVVATATLGAYVGLEGLGLPIFRALATGVQFNEQARLILLVAVVTVALLAIATEQGLDWVQRRLVPEGLVEREQADDPGERAERAAADATA